LITYRKPGRSLAEQRTIDPWHLANINGEWFLFAWDHLRKDLRTFVPARIQSVKKTGETFARPDKFSLDARLRGSFGVHSGQGEYRVVLRFDAMTADYVREKKWHPSQTTKNLKDGGLELRLTLTSLGEIQRWILGWAGHAVVVSPKELADSVREAAQTILQKQS
jgi:predicted DNA-binding transcriptional regulator YafY